jgi:hypothetical protein
MKLALIPPTKHLWQFCGQRDYHLVLPQRVRTDEHYAEFYHLIDGYKILDNGAAEGEFVPRKELFEIADFIGADEIVVPDAIKNQSSTILLAQEFGEQARKHPEYRYMGVVQGKTFAELVFCMGWFAREKWIQVLGLPRNVNDIDAYTRFSLLSAWRGEYRKELQAVHCLGMSEHMQELSLLARLGARGVDTSLPFSLAFNDKLFVEYEYIKRQVDYFNIELESHRLETAAANVRDMDILCEVRVEGS